MARVPLIDPPYDVGRNSWNITRSLANSQACFDAFTRFVGLMAKNRDLTGRQKEVVILRVGALTGSQYEWRRHVRMGRDAGLDDIEIVGIKTGNPTTLSADEQLAMRVAEATETLTMTDELWREASAVFDDSQMTSIVMLAGMYAMVSRFLVALDVDLDADIVDLDHP